MHTIDSIILKIAFVFILDYYEIIQLSPEKNNSTTTSVKSGRFSFIVFRIGC